MLKRAHHWLGALVAAWIMAATFSGLLLLFEDDYYRWRYAALPDTPGLIAPDATVIDLITSNSPGRLTALGMPTESLPAYHAYFADGGEALFHPVAATRVAGWHTFDALPSFLFDLHVYLFLGETGHLVVGSLGLLAAVNIAIGMMLWWRRRKVFRMRHAAPRSTEKKHLLRGHAAQGAMLGAVFLALILSGSAIVFPGPVQAVLYPITGASDTLRPAPGRVSRNVGPVDWERVLATTTAHFPNATLRFVAPPAEPGGAVVMRLRNAGEWHPNGRSYAVLDGGTGELLQSIDATRTGLGPAIFDSLYPIHSGKTGWPGYRALLVIVSVSLFYIAASGAYLYLSRPRRRQYSRSRRGSGSVPTSGA